MTNTHSTQVPDFSAYNTLGERDYEVIDIRDDKNEYHRLHRPHQMARQTSLPTGRLVSTSSSASTQPLLVEPGRSDLVVRSAQRGLDNPHYDVANGDAPPLPPHNSSRSTSSPDLYHHTDGSLPLVNGRPTRRTTSSSARAAMGTATPSSTAALIYDDPHEALYTPGAMDGSGQVHHALQTVPETGTMFPEPTNPSSFPVHVYDYVAAALPPYEVPVPSTPPLHPKHAANSPGAAKAEVVDTLQSNSTNMSMRSSETDYPDLTTSADLTGTGEAVVDFPMSCTPLSSSTDHSPVNRSVGKSTVGESQDHRFSDASHGDHSECEDDFTGGSVPNGRTSVISDMAATRSLPDFSDTTDFVIRPRCSTVGPAPLLEEPDTNTDSSDFTGPVFLPHLFDGVPLKTGHTVPLSNTRVHQYQPLNPLTMDPTVKYTKLHVGRTSLV